MAAANRAAGNAMASDWCGRSALYSLRHASTAAWASSMLANGLMVVQQLQLQGLVQALDLARGRGRAGPGQPLGDAVLPADPLEQHLRRAGLAETPGELLAIVRQHFSGHPVVRIASTNAEHTARPVAR